MPAITRTTPWHRYTTRVSVVNSDGAAGRGHCGRNRQRPYLPRPGDPEATRTVRQVEVAIENTEGFSFAQLRETYILGAQSAFEPGREVMVADVIEAIALQAAGAYDLKHRSLPRVLCANPSLLPAGSSRLSTHKSHRRDKAWHDQQSRREDRVVDPFSLE